MIAGLRLAVFGLLFLVPSMAVAKDPPAGSKAVKVGRFEFLLPGFVLETKGADRPPLHKLFCLVAQNVTFDAIVVDGRATEEERTAYLDQSTGAFAGATSNVETRLPVSGVLLTGRRITRPAALKEHPDAVVEIYTALVGKELFAINLGILEPSPTNTELRELLFKVTDRALAGAAAQRPSAPRVGPSSQP